MKKMKKLALNKSTIKSLSDEEARQVGGGLINQSIWGVCWPVV